MTIADGVRERVGARLGLTFLPALVLAALAGLIAPVVVVEGAKLPPLLLPTIAAVAIVISGSKRVAALGGTALFIGALHVAYVSVVSPIYAYSGLIYVEPPVESLAVAVILALAPALWLPLSLGRASDVFVWVTYLVAYIPSLLVPTYILDGGLEMTFPLIAALFVGFTIIGLANRLPLSDAAPSRGLSWNGISQVVWLAAALTFGYLIFTLGVTFDLPALDAVYEQRAEYSEAARSRQLTGYVVNWGGYVVFPMLLAMGLARGRVSWIAVAVLGQLYVYSISGFKSFALSILFVLVVHVLARWRPDRLASSAAAGAAALVGTVSILSLAGTDVLFALSLLVRRLLVLPGALTGYYYDHFASNETYALSHSVLSFLSTPTYELTPPQLIGMIYFGAPAASANASFWADGMANFGVAGILLASVAVALLLRLLDHVTRERSLLLVAPMVALTAFQLSQGGLLTRLLTGGAIITAVLLAASPSRSRDQTATATARQHPSG